MHTRSDSVLDLLIRALDPADQTMAAEAGADVSRQLARQRHRVVVACLQEIQAESDWIFTSWRSNAAAHNDYSKPSAVGAYLRIRLFISLIRGLSYTTLIFGAPSARPLCTRAVDGLRQSLQTV